YGSACDIGAFESTQNYTVRVVTTLQDVQNGTCTSSVCTLRDAIAPPNPAVPLAIYFKPGLTGSILVGSTGLGTLQITKDTTIIGPVDESVQNSNGITLDGQNNVSVITITAPVNVSLRNLVIQHGNAAQFGGGINNSNAGTLTVSNSTISSNRAGSTGYP